MSGRIRIHINTPFHPASPLPLTPTQTHYLLNVMRLREGDPVHVFNGHQGEWRALFLPHKKQSTLILETQTAQQTTPSTTGLIFSPLKPKRLEFLIEKATELSVGALHPAVMERTTVSKINVDKMESYAIEAAEQCERMTVPAVHKPKKLAGLLEEWDRGKRILWAAERGEDPVVAEVLVGMGPDVGVSFLVGPEGGFTPAEQGLLRGAAFVTPVSLGRSILRAETAALVCLALAAQLSQQRG